LCPKLNIYFITNSVKELAQNNILSYLIFQVARNYRSDLTVLLKQSLPFPVAAQLDGSENSELRAAEMKRSDQTGSYQKETISRKDCISFSSRTMILEYQIY